MLEQLRVLWYGEKFMSRRHPKHRAPVLIPEDLETVRRLFAAR